MHLLSDVQGLEREVAMVLLPRLQIGNCLQPRSYLGTVGTSGRPGWLADSGPSSRYPGEKRSACPLKVVYASQAWAREPVQPWHGTLMPKTSVQNFANQANCQLRHFMPKYWGPAQPRKLKQEAIIVADFLGFDLEQDTDKTKERTYFRC